ncbi:hypothetical protein ED21_30674 [Erythrobacter sp. SD-21]|nr:hypothetical protein ED21_30674 [Erythrobacter sp. SD-21]
MVGDKIEDDLEVLRVRSVDLRLAPAGGFASEFVPQE